MTSNSPEHNPSSSPERSGPSDPRFSGPASGAPGGGSGTGTGSALSGGDSSDGGRTSSPSGAPSASPARSADPSSSAASGTGIGRGTGTGTETGTGTTAKARGKKGGKTTSSGGDWNVFRTVVVLVGLVIAGFGAYYLILGTAGLPDTEARPVNPTLENQFRFFSAMMIGVGAAFITIAVKFQWANMLWLVCLMVFVGGIGRVLSWAFSGTPNYILIILMIVELAFPPALLVWHKYIAKTSDLRREFAQRS